MGKTAEAIERETSILFNDEEDTATVTTNSGSVAEKMRKIDGVEEGEKGEDGSLNFTIPKASIGLGKVRKERVHVERTPEQKIEKLRQLRVGKHKKRLMEAGKTEAQALAEATKVYGVAGKATKAATQGNDPFKEQNAPGFGKKQAAAPAAKTPPVTGAAKKAERQAGLATGKKNAGLN